MGWQPEITTCTHSFTWQYPKIEGIMNHVSRPGVITTTQLFQFLGKEIGTPKMC